MSGGDPMKPVHPDVKLTYDDYVHFPDDGLRHELKPATCSRPPCFRAWCFPSQQSSRT